MCERPRPKDINQSSHIAPRWHQHGNSSRYSQVRVYGNTSWHPQIWHGHAPRAKQRNPLQLAKYSWVHTCIIDCVWECGSSVSQNMWVCVAPCQRISRGRVCLLQRKRETEGDWGKGGEVLLCVCVLTHVHPFTKKKKKKKCIYHLQKSAMVCQSTVEYHVNTKVHEYGYSSIMVIPILDTYHGNTMKS